MTIDQYFPPKPPPSMNPHPFRLPLIPQASQAHHWLACLLLCLTACSRTQQEATAQPAETKPPIEILAQQATTEAFSTLSSRLMEVITAEGIPAAIHVCSREAGDLLKQTGNKHGVTMRRVTDRPRNPQNQAGPPDLEVMETYRAAISKEIPPAPHIHGNTVRLPIRIAMPLCLNCHGDPTTDIAPDTLSAIQALYPQDMATGYQEGQLRGLWRVEFPKE
jgi:hypothetical protein